MEEEKYLSVMDLAAQVGVPRTTINDWLSKYSQFITSVQQGRRKVYPSNTVTILKEIGSLRSSGLSFTEIEKTLSLSHPVQAVPATDELPLQDVENKPENPDYGEKVSREISGEPAGTKSSSVKDQQTAAPSADTSLQVMPATKDDFACLVESMAMLSAKMLEENKKRSRFLRIVSIIFFLLLLLLAGGFTLLYTHFLQLSRTNRSLEEQNRETHSRLTATENKSLMLQTENSSFKLNIRQLEKELAQQRKSFDQAIAKSLEANKNALKEEQKRSERLLSEKEARIALEREKFTAEKLRLLQELEKTRSAKQPSSILPGKEAKTETKINKNGKKNTKTVKEKKTDKEAVKNKTQTENKEKKTVKNKEGSKNKETVKSKEKPKNKENKENKKNKDEIKNSEKKENREKK